MKIRRLTVLVASIFAASICICVAFVAYWQQTQPVLKDASKLMSAVRTFSRERIAQGQPLPSSVSLHELINGSYLKASDVHAFDGMDVTISLSADQARPQEILIRVRLSDGSEIAQMADGSIQQLPK